MSDQQNPHVYACVIDRVVDGDTVDVHIDLGFDVWLNHQRVRLAGIDAPESRTRDLEEKTRGLASTAWLEKALPVGSAQILISTDYVRGKYGRIIGDFITPGGSKITTLLVENQMATYKEYGS